MPAEKFCPACDVTQEPPDDAADAYLSALSDVTVRGLDKSAALLCDDHQRALARHISAQVEVTERLRQSARARG